MRGGETGSSGNLGHTSGFMSKVVFEETRQMLELHFVFFTRLQFDITIEALKASFATTKLILESGSKWRKTLGKCERKQYRGNRRG